MRVRVSQCVDILLYSYLLEACPSGDRFSVPYFKSTKALGPCLLPMTVPVRWSFVLRSSPGCYCRGRARFRCSVCDRFPLLPIPRSGFRYSAHPSRYHALGMTRFVYRLWFFTLVLQQRPY